MSILKENTLVLIEKEVSSLEFNESGRLLLTINTIKEGVYFILDINIKHKHSHVALLSDDNKEGETYELQEEPYIKSILEYLGKEDSTLLGYINELNIVKQPLKGFTHNAFWLNEELRGSGIASDLYNIYNIVHSEMNKEFLQKVSLIKFYLKKGFRIKRIHVPTKYEFFLFDSGEKAYFPFFDTSISQAQLLESLLESEGLPCFLPFFIELESRGDIKEESIILNSLGEEQLLKLKDFIFNNVSKDETIYNTFDKKKVNELITILGFNYYHIIKSFLFKQGIFSLIEILISKYNNR